METLGAFAYVFVFSVFLLIVYSLCKEHKKMMLGLSRGKMNTWCDICSKKKQSSEVLMLTTRLFYEGWEKSRADKIFEKFPDLKLNSDICDVCWERMKATIEGI